MIHPELATPTCMSCGRELTPCVIWGISMVVKHRVPDDVDCCSRCWSRVPVADRMRIVISIRDRSLGGILSVAAEMASEAILERRNGQ